MKILVLTNQFPPDVNSSGQLMKQIFSNLAGLGRDVTVITTFPHYEDFQVWDEYKCKLYEKDSLECMRVIRVWSYTWGKKNMINRFLNYFSYNLLAIFAALFSSNNFDVIFAQNGSFFSGVSAWLIGKFHNAPYIYNIQDLYPEVPIRAGKLENRWLISILRKIEKIMYRKASEISVITPIFKKNISKKGISPKKISIVPNFVDTDFIRPLSPSNHFSKKHDLENKFVLCHSGYIGTAYDLESLLKVAKQLSGFDEILFLIIGDGIAKPALVEKAKQLDLDNVRFLPYQPREELPWIRASSDVQVSLYEYGSALYSMPSKIYEIMASSRPILASAESDTDVSKLIEKVNCGVCVEPEHPEQLKEAVIRLYENPDLCKKMGENGRDYVVKHNSLEVIIDRYETLLSDCV